MPSAGVVFFVCLFDHSPPTASQLEDYEEAVMLKRLEEMPEAELSRMLDEVEAERGG